MNYQTLKLSLLSLAFAAASAQPSSASTISSNAELSLFAKELKESRENWKEWANNYHQDHSPLSSRLIKNSNTIQIIIKNDYGVEIPFDIKHAYRYSSIFIDLKNSNIVSSEKSCAAVAVRLLGSATSASIGYSGPSFVAPGYSNEYYERLRQSNQDYKELALKALGSYCNSERTKIFEPAIRAFLADLEKELIPYYKSEITKQTEVIKLAQITQERKTQEAKALAEQKELADRIAEEKRQREVLAAAQEKRRAQELERRQREEQELAERQQRKQELMLRISKLKSGEIPVKSIEDAALRHDAESDYGIVYYPPSNQTIKTIFSGAR